MNHSPLSQIACRTAASQSSGRSMPLLFEKEPITLSMSVPCAQQFVMYITSVRQNRDIFSLLVHALCTNDSQVDLASTGWSLVEFYYLVSIVM